MPNLPGGRGGKPWTPTPATAQEAGPRSSADLAGQRAEGSRRERGSGAGTHLSRALRSPRRSPWPRRSLVDSAGKQPPRLPGPPVPPWLLPLLPLPPPLRWPAAVPASPGRPAAASAPRRASPRRSGTGTLWGGRRTPCRPGDRARHSVSSCTGLPAGLRPPTRQVRPGRMRATRSCLGGCCPRSGVPRIPSQLPGSQVGSAVGAARVSTHGGPGVIAAPRWGPKFGSTPTTALGAREPFHSTSPGEGHPEAGVLKRGCVCGVILPLWGHVARSGNIWGCHTWASRDAAPHPTELRTAGTEKDLAPKCRDCPRQESLPGARGKCGATPLSCDRGLSLDTSGPGEFPAPHRVGFLTHLPPPPRNKHAAT